MQPINVTGFQGSNQLLDPRQLPETVGVTVVDADPRGGGHLEPLKARTTVATVPASPQRQTIWRMGRDVPNDAQYWLGWSNVVTPTLGFGNDTTERTYYTGDGTPKWTNNVIGLTGGPPYPQATRELAVPAPTSALTATLTTDGTSGDEAEVFYVETFVNDLGWESAPGPVSNGVLCKPGAILALSSLGTPPAGNYGFVTRRIYRTQAGTNNSADFYFLIEVPIATTSTTDDARQLGGLLATEGWLPPPTDGFGLVTLWNSMMAMLSGKELYICEAGFPYAWPLKYVKEFKDTPVATACWGQNLLVLTTGTPVCFYGQDPASITDQPPGLAQACRSARGVVSFSFGVVWPSNEGLAFYGDRGQYLVTKDILTPDQWRALNPDTMVAGRWGRFYVCSYNVGTQKGFMIDPLNPAGGIWYLSQGFDACHYDELADQLYVLNGGNVNKFAAGSSLTANYVSKQFLQPYAVNYGYCKVVATAYPVTVKIYANGSLSETRTVNDRYGFTLKSGFTAEDWQVEIDSNQKVQLVRLAMRMSDLKGI
jgi:hypothetical protein